MKLIEIRNGKGGKGISMKSWIGDGKDAEKDGRMTLAALATAAGMVVRDRAEGIETQTSMINSAAFHMLAVVAEEHGMSMLDVVDIYMKEMEKQAKEAKTIVKEAQEKAEQE